MSSLIQIRLTGVDEADKALRGFASMMLDLRPFWPLVVPLFIAWMGEQFDTEGSWGGAAWAPLTADYAAYKAAKHPGRSILIAEGAMRQAASRPARVSTPSMLTLTIVDPKIGYHQEGNSRGMPARPVIPDELPASAQEQLHDAAERYVADAIRRFGL